MRGGRIVGPALIVAGMALFPGCSDGGEPLRDSVSGVPVEARDESPDNTGESAGSTAVKDTVAVDSVPDESTTTEAPATTKAPDTTVATTTTTAAPATTAKPATTTTAAPAPTAAPTTQPTPGTDAPKREFITDPMTQLKDGDRICEVHPGDPTKRSTVEVEGRTVRKGDGLIYFYVLPPAGISLPQPIERRAGTYATDETLATSLDPAAKVKPTGYITEGDCQPNS